MLVLEILEYIFEALLVWIGTPGGSLTVLATVALGLWWLTRWHNKRRRAGEPGVEYHHLILFGLVGAALCLAVAAAGYAWQTYARGATVSIPVAALKIVAPAPNPATELLHGPYQPEDIRNMNEALIRANAVMTGKAEPACQEGMLVIQDWQNQLGSHSGIIDPNAFMERFRTLMAHVDEVSVGVNKAAADSEPYKEEIFPAFNNVFGTGVVDQINWFLADFAALSPVDTQGKLHVLGRRVEDIRRALETFCGSAATAKQNITTKIRRLRDYKVGQ